MQACGRGCPKQPVRRANALTRGRVQMRRPVQVTRKTLITMAAAGGVLALGGGYAHADSTAAGHAVGSPGLLSGNNVQAPVDVPVNACGNTVNVIALLNPAFGNRCANAPDGPQQP